MYFVSIFKAIIFDLITIQKITAIFINSHHSVAMYWFDDLAATSFFLLFYDRLLCSFFVLQQKQIANNHSHSSSVRRNSLHLLTKSTNVVYKNAWMNHFSDIFYLTREFHECLTKFVFSFFFFSYIIWHPSTQ